MTSARISAALRLQACSSAYTHCRNGIPAGNPHLDPVFPTIVDKNNERIILCYAINRYARRSDLLVTFDVRSQHRDVVVGFAIAVAQRELVPLRGAGTARNAVDPLPA